MTIVWLVRAFFAANVLLYGLIAARTTIGPDAAAAAAGISLRSAAARSEFLTVHAGLPLALAALFAVLMVEDDSQRLGLRVAIAFYVPIVVYRTLPPMVVRGRYQVAAGAVLIESAMLAAAIGLLIAF